jgi:hypothetical protein
VWLEVLSASGELLHVLTLPLLLLLRRRRLVVVV